MGTLRLCLEHIKVHTKIHLGGNFSPDEVNLSGLTVNLTVLVIPSSMNKMCFSDYHEFYYKYTSKLNNMMEERENDIFFSF